jgi:hypothetical protein
MEQTLNQRYFRRDYIEENFDRFNDVLNLFLVEGFVI